MMHALNDLASQVIAVTMKTEKAQAYFLYYCATNLDTYIVYYACDMIIRGNTDAAYLVNSKAQNKYVTYTFMGNKDEINQIINGKILIIARILTTVVVLTAEVAIASLYHGAHKIVPL